MRKVIHIGLPKTGSTFLQRRVFPQLVDDQQLEGFNDPSILREARRCHCIGFTDQDFDDFRNYFDSQGVYLHSDESLTGWNFEQVEEKADLNLRLFGADAEVILFLREPFDWLRSVYLQALHQGFVRSPESFFVGGSYYSQISGGLHPGDLSLFNLESFCYRSLVEAYRARFVKVTVLSYDSLQKPFALLEALGFDLTRKLKDKNLLGGGSIANRGYSRLGVSLTLRREKILNFFGCQSIRVGTFQQSFLDRIAGKGANSPLSRRKKPSMKRRVIGRIRSECQWRHIVQQRIDRIFPYRKYQLPEGVVPENVIRKNRDFCRLSCENV